MKARDIWYIIYNRGIRKLIPKYQNHTIFTRFYWRTLKDRLTKGYDESELWSLDYSLTKLIAPRIKDFAKDFEINGGGIPGWILEEENQKSIKKGFKWDSQKWCMADKKEDRKCFQRASKRWSNILNEIAAGFEDMELENKDWCAWTKKWEPTVKKWQKKLDKAKTFKQKEAIWNEIGSFRKYNERCVVSEDDVTHTLHQNAIEMLSKYYHSLWQ